MKDSDRTIWFWPLDGGGHAILFDGDFVAFDESCCCSEGCCDCTSYPASINMTLPGWSDQGNCLSGCNSTLEGNHVVPQDLCSGNDVEYRNDDITELEIDSNCWGTGLEVTIECGGDPATFDINAQVYIHYPMAGSGCFWGELRVVGLDCGNDSFDIPFDHCTDASVCLPDGGDITISWPVS